jgi:hypothetical protein
MLVSEAADQWEWAKTLLANLSPQASNLPKWSKARPGFKRRFTRGFHAMLSETQIYGLAISARASVIDGVFEELIDQLQLRSDMKVEGDVVELGPTTRGEFIQLPRKEAAPIVFICHFVLRMHAALLVDLRMRRGWEWCDWQISPDNFQHGINGPMATLFSNLLNSAPVLRLSSGSLRTITFTEGDPGNDVADLVAGALASSFAPGRTSMTGNATKPTIGKLYWERWGFDS